MPPRIVKFDIDRLEHVDNTFWCWFAGFFDGEGNIDIHGNNIRVSQSGTRAEQLMREIQETIGGSIHFYTNLSKPHYLPQWKWWVCKRDHTVAILNKLLPHLRIKRQEAIDMLNMPKKRNKFEWSDQEIKSLREMYGRMRISILVFKLNRTKFAIQKKAKELGLATGKWYSEVYKHEIFHIWQNGCTIRRLSMETGISKTTLSLWINNIKKSK